MTAIAPTSSHRKYRLPCLVMLPSLSLPPVVCCFGTNPIQAARLRPDPNAVLMLHRTRQLLVRQRTMLSNALRGHLAELGFVSAKGRNGTAELFKIIGRRVLALSLPT